MQITMDFEEIFGRYFERLIQFCYQHSDYISLTTQAGDDLTEEERKKAQKGVIEYIDKQHQRRKNMFETDVKYREKFLRMFPDEENALEQLQQLYQMDLDFYHNLCEYGDSEEGSRTAPYLEQQWDFSPYPLMKKEITYITPCTRSSEAKAMFFFQIDDQIRQSFAEMENLFDIVYLGEYPLEDPVFYRGDEILLSVCSHEHMAALSISEEEYEAFLALEIPHMVVEKMWWMEEYEKHYKRTDGSVPIIFGRGSISGIYGSGFQFPDLEHMEKNQKIFNEYKHKLEPNLRTVTDIMGTIKERYELEEKDSEEICHLIRGNVLFNTCLARHLPEDREMKLFLYRVKREGSGLFLYYKQRQEYHQLMKRKKKFPLQLQPRSYREGEILIGGEYNSGYIFVEGSIRLRQEVIALRGLNEFELRNRELVANYVKAAQIYT